MEIYDYRALMERIEAKKYYTVGWYDCKTKRLAKKGQLLKIGKNPPKEGKDLVGKDRDPNYLGGIVFHNKKEIIQWLIDEKVKNKISLKHMGVYEIIDCYIDDIYRHEDGYYYLLYDMFIKTSNIKIKKRDIT